MPVLTPFEWLQVGGFVFTAGGIIAYMRLTQNTQGEKINELAKSNNEMHSDCENVKRGLSTFEHRFVPREEAYQNFVTTKELGLKLELMAEKLERGLDSNKHVLESVDSIKRMVEIIHSKRSEDR